MNDLLIDTLVKWATPYGGYQSTPFTPQQFTPGVPQGLGADKPAAPPPSARSRLQSRRSGPAAPAAPAPAQAAGDMNLGAQYRAHMSAEQKRLDDSMQMGHTKEDEWVQARNQQQEALQQFAARQQLLQNANKPKVQGAPNQKPATPGKPGIITGLFQNLFGGGNKTGAMAREESVIDMLVKLAAPVRPPMAVRVLAPGQKGPMAKLSPFQGQVRGPAAIPAAAASAGAMPPTSKPAIKPSAGTAKPLTLPPTKANSQTPAPVVSDVVKGAPVKGMSPLKKMLLGVGGVSALAGIDRLTETAPSGGGYPPDTPQAGQSPGMGFDHPPLDLNELAKTSAWVKHSAVRGEGLWNSMGVNPPDPASKGDAWMQGLWNSMGVNSPDATGFGGQAAPAGGVGQPAVGPVASQSAPAPVAKPAAPTGAPAAPASNAAPVGGTVAPPSAPSAAPSAGAKAAAWALNLADI